MIDHFDMRRKIDRRNREIDNTWDRTHVTRYNKNNWPLVSKPDILR